MHLQKLWLFWNVATKKYTIISIFWNNFVGNQLIYIYCSIKKKSYSFYLEFNRNYIFHNFSLQVSWIRKARHPVVLSSGTAIFTSDRRFQIQTSQSKTSDSKSWNLKIDPVLEKDDGFYECQVNTQETMTLVFKLNVERKL